MKLGVKYASPVFDGATYEQVQEELRKAGLPEDGRVHLYDGHTGKKMDQKTTIGYMYMLKLNHLVEDKMHARSIGPRSEEHTSELQSRGHLVCRRLLEKRKQRQ